MVKAVTGPTACHSVIISERGHAWVFGRNERGQMGTKSKNCQDFPVKVTSIAENRQSIGDRKIVGAATGRNHTLLLTGELYIPNGRYGSHVVMISFSPRLGRSFCSW